MSDSQKLTNAYRQIDMIREAMNDISVRVGELERQFNAIEKLAYKIMKDIENEDICNK